MKAAKILLTIAILMLAVLSVCSCDVQKYIDGLQSDDAASGDNSANESNGDSSTTEDAENNQGNTSEFGIASVVKSSSAENVDIYTVEFTDGTTATFSVKNNYNPENSETLFGIADITSDSNGDAALVMSNGSVIKIGKILGEKATEDNVEKASIFIVAAEINTYGELVLSFSDNTSVNVGTIMGSDAEGSPNEEEATIGLSEVKLSEDGALSITLTNGTSVNLGKISETYGDGKKSITKAEINTDGELVFSFSDGTSINSGKISGVDGLGIANIHINENGALVLTLINGASIVLDGKNDEQFTFALIENGTAYQITGITESDTREIVIPETYRNLPVISIGDSAFKNHTAIESITIPNGVTHIANSAFSGCVGLTNITIPDSVTTIGDSAFESCSSITGITIPQAVISIGKSAFAECTGLEEIRFNASAASDLSSNGNVFSSSGTGEKGIRLVIGKNVTKIPAYLFYGAKNITSLEFEKKSSCVNIGKYAFHNCSSLSTVSIPNSINTIEQYAFNSCNKLAEVHISDIAAWCGISLGNFNSSPLHKGANLYLNGSLIKELVIPDNVTEIKRYAFCNLDTLTSITLGTGLTIISNGAFYNCTALTNISFNATVMDDLAVDNNAFYNAGKNAQGITVIVGKKVTKIPAYLFYSADSNCSPNVVSIRFDENSVCKSIGRGAFENCVSLVHMEVPISITSVVNAFEGCTNLAYNEYGNAYYLGNENYLYVYLVKVVNTEIQSCDIHNYTRAICSGAFKNCKKLKNISIPDNIIDDIDISEFSDCTSLQYNEYDNAYYFGSNERPYLWLMKAKNNSIYTCVIHNQTKSIAENAFLGCNTLYEVFNLSVLNIKAGTTSQGYAGYYALNVYTSLDVPSKQWVTDEEFLFYEDGDTCYLLGYKGDKTEITLPENCNGKNYGIYQYAFFDDNQITKVTIPANVTSIGSSAFYNCSSITSITIGTSVTSIGERAFYNCSSLTSVIIPKSVTSIGGYAFHGCTCLNQIYYLGNNKQEWHTIVIETGNTAIPVYFCETQPTYEGNFWHYVNGEAVKWQESEYNYLYSKGLKFTSNGNGTCYVSAIGSCVDTAIKIPPVSPTGDTVLEIGENAFRFCYDIFTSITIPDSVTSIGSMAFSGCSSLTNITIPDSVTSIGSWAFNDCTSLTSVTFGNGVTSIGSWAFDDCTSLTSVTFGNGVTSIGSWAFDNCTALEEIYFNAAVMNDLNSGTFDNAGKNGNGIKVVIGKNVTKIPAYLFEYAKFIQSVEFEEGSICESIGKYAFYGCTSLTSVTIPNSVTYISNSAFYYCSSLTNVTIGNSVTSIGGYAFYGCSSLTSITIPDSVTSIGDSAFYDCTALEEIYFNASAMRNLSNNNYVFSYAGKDGNGIKVVIGKNVTKIPAYLFSPAYFDSSRAPKIVSVKFEEGSVCESIGDYAFQNCSSLTSITIPDSVTSIYSWTFSGCSSLTNVTIGNSVTSIGNRAFSGCSSLEEIYFNAAAMNDLSFGTFDSAGKNGNGIKVVIGKNVTKIPAYLFCQYGSLSYPPKIVSVAFEEGSACESIGDYAFQNCSSLTNVTIGNSVTSIGGHAFYGCSSLTSITIPDSITSIGDYAFYDCTALEEIYFNASAMRNLSNNNYVFSYAGKDGNGIKVVIGKNVTKIPAYLFKDAEFIQSVEFAEGSACESIGEHAFYHCTSLTSVTIPNSVTSIGEHAFDECSRLTSVTIPNSVTSIGEDAFWFCRSLTSVYYTGTAEEWAKISIGSYNSSLDSATVYYYSEEEPATEGNFWHYGDNGEIVVW